MDKSKRGAKMKEYEKNTKEELDNTQCFLIRLDGHKFSTFTKGFAKPYDMRSLSPKKKQQNQKETFFFSQNIFHQKKTNL